MAGISNFPQGGAKINGIIKERSIQAGNTIEAGDFVTGPDGNGITLGAMEQVTSVSCSASKVLYLTPTLGIIVFTQSGSPVGLYACLINLSNNAITSIGTKVQLSSETYDDLQLSKISDTSVLIVGRVSSTLKSAVLTISGSTLTFNTPATMSGNGYLSLTKLTAATWLLTYANNSNYGGSVIISVSGTAVSFSSPYTFASSQIYGTNVCALSSTLAIVCYARSATYHMIALTISGTTIAAPGNTLQPIGFTQAIVKLSSTTCITCRTQSSNWYISKLTVSGTALSIGTDSTFSDTDSGMHQSADMVLLPNSKVLLTICTGQLEKYCFLTPSESAILVGEMYPLENVQGIRPNCSLMYDAEPYNCKILYGSMPESWLARVGVMTADTEIENEVKLATNAPFLGVAKTGGSAWGHIDVYTL